MRANAPFTLCSLAFAAALMTPANTAALETRSYADFIQILAIQPRPDGGFMLAGFLRGSAGSTPSAVQQVDASGNPIGEPAILSPPDSQHQKVWVYGLLALPNGDYVVSGWAETQRGKTDGWLARISPEGHVVWNVVTEHAWDQRLYLVKRLANGDLVAAGRVQQGAQESRLPARGFAAVVKESSGEVVWRKEFPFDNATLRSGFQDVAEMADGNLLFAGWMTKRDGTDDVWLLKTTPTGDRIRPVSFGDAGNDIAWAALPFGTGAAIAATIRRSRDSSVASVLVYDRDLARRGAVNLDRWVQGASQARAAVAIPATDQVIVVGQSQKPNSLDATAMSAVISTRNSTATVEEAGGGSSTFRAVAVDSSGAIAMAGDGREARDRPLRGVLGVRPGAAACTPERRQLEEISAALSGGGKQRFSACATADQPTRLRIGRGRSNTAVFIRPVIGDVDAFLMRGDDILDASLNARQRPEFLPLPPNEADLEVAVSSTTPLAVFEIGLVGMDAAANDTTAARVVDRPEGKDLPGEESDTPTIPEALQVLGYDLLGWEHTPAITVEIGITRATMAFQAGEGFSVTGDLPTEELDRLFEQAARRIDVDARGAAETAREVARTAKEIQFTRPNNLLRSLRAGIHNGRLYGVGRLQTGAIFEGEWLDGLDADANARPGLGVLRYSADCSISIRNTGVGAVFNIPALLKRSLGVLRLGNKIAFARDLQGLVEDGQAPQVDQLALICTRRQR